MTAWDHGLALQQLCDYLRSLQTRVDGPVVIGLDGRSGSGKSTLAAQVVTALGDATVSVIEGDEFYGGGSATSWDLRSAEEKVARAMDWRRQDDVLRQLRLAGHASWYPFDWEASDWDADQVPLSAERRSCSATAIVILEGAYTCRPELHGHLDGTVLLDPPRAVRREQLRRREGDEYRSDWEGRWAEAEDLYFDTVMPPSSFNLVLDGSPLVLQRSRPLSDAARRRLANPSAPEPVQRPALDRHDEVASWRQAVHDIWGEDTKVGEPAHRRRSIGGVDVLESGPADAPVVVYAHGGGFCLGSAATSIPITARLATHLRIVSVDYRLAPEWPHPAALDDLLAVCEVVGKRGRFALAGDSAGAWLALRAAAARDRSARPVALALLSPYLPPLPDSDPVAAPLIDAYFDSHPSSERQPIVDPTLPPTLVQLGEQEPASAAEHLVNDLRNHGVEATAVRYRDMWHTWHYHRDLPEADDALLEAGEWLRQQLGAA